MAETLFILLDEEEPLRWRLAKAPGDTLQSGSEGELPALAASFTGEAVALIPGSLVLRTSAQVPSSQPRQVQQAVPYLVEERLVADVEDCFFALGARTASGVIEVGVVAQARMAAWTQRLQALPIPVTRLLSDADLLPVSAGATALLDGDIASLRWGEGETLVTGRENLALALGLLPPKARASIQVFLPKSDAAKVKRQLKALIADKATQVEIIPLAEPPLAWRLRNYLDGSLPPPINYLQGAYRAPRPRTGLPQRWRRVAALAGGALALHLLMLLGQGLYLSAAASHYQDEARALYQQVFPEDQGGGDYRRRWNNRLGRSGRGGSDFLPLFAQSAANLQGAGVTLVSVNFTEARGDLLLQVEAETSEALVAYTQGLAGAGLSAEIGSISQEGERVRGSVRIAGGR